MGFRAYFQRLAEERREYNAPRLAREALVEAIAGSDSQKVTSLLSSQDVRIRKEFTNVADKLLMRAYNEGDPGIFAAVMNAVGGQNQLLSVDGCSNAEMLLCVAIEDGKADIARIMAESPATDVENCGIKCKDHYPQGFSALEMSRKHRMSEVTAILAERVAARMRMNADTLSAEAAAIRKHQPSQNRRALPPVPPSLQ
jgi:hypothetical protein